MLMKIFRNLFGNVRKTQEDLQSEKMKLDILNDIYQTTRQHFEVYFQTTKKRCQNQSNSELIDTMIFDVEDYERHHLQKQYFLLLDVSLFIYYDFVRCLILGYI